MGKFWNWNYKENICFYQKIKIRAQDKSVERELDILKKLNKKGLYPLFQAIKKDEAYYITSLHGQNFGKLRNFWCQRRFKLITIYKIIKELIIYLQNLHDIGYLHYYLKEDNIILALEPLNVNNNDSNFIIIDYGLSVPFVVENNLHYSRFHKYKRCGNYYFDSIKELEGQEIGRK